MKFFVAFAPLIFSATLVSAQVEIVDDLGRSVALSLPARRIISLAPSITETLFAIGAGDQVVGVTDFCDFPPGARTKQSIGGMIGPSIETIVALEPDLVIVTPEGNAQESFRQIRSMEIPVFVTNPRSLEGIRKSIRDVGTLAGRVDTALSMAENMKRKEDSLRVTTPTRLATLFIISLQPLIVAGPGSFLAEMIELAGGDNIAKATGLSYPTFSREQVVAMDPALILMTTGLGGKEAMASLYPECKAVTAFASGRVYEIEANLVSRPGPRAMEGAVRIRDFLLGEGVTGRKP